MHDSTTGTRRLSLDSAAAWVLTATAVIAVLIYIPFSWAPFVHTKVVVLTLGALLTLVLFVLGTLKRGSIALPHLSLVGSLWLVPLAYLLSTLFSGTNPAAAFFGTGFSPDSFGLFLLLALLATLASFVLSTPEFQKRFVKGVVLAFLLLLLSEVVFLVAGKLFPALIAPTGNLVGSFIDLGFLVGLGVSLALLWSRFLATNRKIVLYVAIILGLIVLALVNSVIAWVLVSLVAFGLFVEAVMHAQSRTENAVRRPLALPLLTLIAGLLFMLGSSTVGSALSTLAGTTYIDARPSLQSTFLVGTHTYASSPLFGTGPGTFGREWLQHRDRSINDSIFWSVDFTSGIGHVPTSFVTTGVIGVLAWIAFFALFLFFGLRSLLMRLPTEAWPRFISIASFTGALYVLILAVAALPGPVTLGIGFLLLGLFIASRPEAEGRTLTFSQNPRIGFALVFALTLLLIASLAYGYVVVSRYVADVSYNQAGTALSAGTYDAAQSAVTRSIALAPQSRTYRLAALIGYARMSQVVNNSSLTQAEARDQFQTAVGSAITSALQATTLDQNDYQNWAMLGNIYASLVPLTIEGAYENAKGAYEKAVALAPTNPSLPYVLGQLEIARGNTEAAEAYLIEAINLKRDYTQAILLFAQTEVTSGKTAQALQAAEAAAYFAPNDPGVLLQVGLLRSAAGDTAGAIQALARASEINPQFANARFFLGVMYAISGDYEKAIAEISTVASFSPENATAVAADLETLQQGKNPFPTSRLAAFGIPYAPLAEPRPAGVVPAQ
ncbi:MAG: tetratricopeptide repeat protein [Candidatus Pacebacteria bacterium]|nr:tetratricopeptide repeat protein [Candidatus Paceibacterota bacterium]